MGELKLRLTHEADYGSESDNEDDCWKDRWEYYINTFPYNKCRFRDEWTMVEYFGMMDKYRRNLNRLFESAIGEHPAITTSFYLMVSMVWEAFHFLIVFGEEYIKRSEPHRPPRMLPARVRRFDDLIDDNANDWNMEEENHIKRFFNLHI